MTIKERILFSFCKDSQSNKNLTLQEEWNFDNALSILCRVFPDFMGLITDKEILDFGCGSGYQSIALALNGAKYVLGIDTNQKCIKIAKDLAKKTGVDGRVEFGNTINSFKNKFDIVISQNSMEHFNDPLKIINEMKSLLQEEGLIFITFGPPWFAPYGSHMHFFTKLPWINIIFDEKTVMHVRSNFRHDGATRYEEVGGGLNKMTVGKFEQFILNSDMRIEYKKYDCVKSINFLGKIPIIKELFINHVSCCLANKNNLR